MAFTHTKKVDIESFIKARIRNRIRSQTSGSGSDHKGPDPDPQHCWPGQKRHSATVVSELGLLSIDTVRNCFYVSQLG
jgi:hypothetical protein